MDYRITAMIRHTLGFIVKLGGSDFIAQLSGTLGQADTLFLSTEYPPISGFNFELLHKRSDPLQIHLGLKGQLRSLRLRLGLPAG